MKRNEQELKVPSAGRLDLLQDLGLVGVTVALGWGVARYFVPDTPLPVAPAVAGSSAAVLRYVIGSPVGRRTKCFLEKFITRFSDPRLKEEDAEALLNSEAFADVLIPAFRIGVQTADDEKHRLLLNALMNCAIDGPPAAFLRPILMRLLESLDPTHVQLLDLLREPQAYYDRHGIVKIESNAPLQTWIATAIPALRDRLLMLRVWLELEREGFIREPGGAEIRLNAHTRPVTLHGVALKFLDLVRDPDALRKPGT